MTTKRNFGIALAIFTLLLVFFVLPRGINRNSPACTLEAKLCPDGSYVGRTGLNCEFAECPEISWTSDWTVFTDPGSGIVFQYPKKLATKYIFPIDWPPRVQVLNEPFTCTEAGSETDRPGKTEKQVIDGHTYCVTKVTQGAAGSLYTQYAYITVKDSRVLDFTFSLRFSQCGNYSEPQKTECENERQAFNIYPIPDLIIQSAR